MTPPGSSFWEGEDFAGEIGPAPGARSRSPGGRAALCASFGLASFFLSVVAVTYQGYLLFFFWVPLVGVASVAMWAALWSVLMITAIGAMVNAAMLMPRWRPPGLPWTTGQAIGLFVGAASLAATVVTVYLGLSRT